MPESFLYGRNKCHDGHSKGIGQDGGGNEGNNKDSSLPETPLIKIAINTSER